MRRWRAACPPGQVANLSYDDISCPDEPSSFLPSLMRIVFLGTGDMGVPVLRWLLDESPHEVAGIVTQPDKPAGRKMELRPSPIKRLASELGQTVLQPEKVRHALANLTAREPDAIVVMAYGQLLPKMLLETPRLACLNLHASLLPRHRGAAPVQAAIEAGDAESGMTVMYMAEGLDIGDILLQRPFALAPDETGGSLHQRLADDAPAALAEALDLLARGPAPRLPQDESAATYAGKLTREHGRLDWRQPAAALERKIRALDPWPAAFTTWRTETGSWRLKIFRAEIMAETVGPAGMVINTGGDSFAIGAGEGALRMREVQLEGKRRMSAGDFLKGNSFAPGTIFG